MKTLLFLIPLLFLSCSDSSSETPEQNSSLVSEEIESSESEVETSEEEESGEETPEEESSESEVETPEESFEVEEENSESEVETPEEEKSEEETPEEEKTEIPEEFVEEVLEVRNLGSIQVFENPKYEILSREAKRISILLPQNLRVLKSVGTQSVSRITLSIFYPDSSAYLEDLEFLETDGIWELELLNFPVIADSYRFAVSVFDDSNETIMSGELVTNLQSEIEIPLSFVEPKVVELSVLTDISLQVSDTNISLKFQVSNPSNDTNLSYEIFGDPLLFETTSGISANSGTISPAEISELELLIPNSFQKGTSYIYKFSLISGNGNLVSQFFEIYIPYERISPRVRLLFPTEPTGIEVEIGDSNITFLAHFDKNVSETNWSLENSSFTFQNSTSNPAVLDFNGSISDTVVLKVLDENGLVSITKYILNLNDEVAPEIPTVVFPNIVGATSTLVSVSGEPNTEILVDGVSSGEIPSSGTSEVEVSLSSEGNNTISISLQDRSGNIGDERNITIFRDTTPPERASFDFFTTNSISPNLIGEIPAGGSWVSVEVAGENYTPDTNGTHWNLEIPYLEEGYYDVNITGYDEFNNSSSKYIRNSFRVLYSAFLKNPKIEGVRYVSGSFEGNTNISGMFKYEDSVELFLGNFSLGSLPISYLEDGELDFLKVVNGSETQDSYLSRNTIRLLASFDADKDISNGILIDSATAEAFVLANPSIDLETNISENSDISDIFNDLAPHFGEHRGLISEEDASTLVSSLISGELVQISYTSEENIISILSGTLQSVEGPVEGVAFRSGSQSGFTDENGTFYYEDGKKVRFSIGMMELSETDAKATMTPYDMVESVSFDHPKPRNIASFLTMVDAISGDAKVSIDQAVRDAIDKYRSPVDLNLPDGAENLELNISASENEFLAQFDRFEIGYELMEEINVSRGVSLSRTLHSLSGSLEDLQALQVSANADKVLEKLYEGVSEFHIFQRYMSWTAIDAFTILVNGDAGMPVFSARSEKDPIEIEYPIRYNEPVSRYLESEYPTYHAPMVSAGTVGNGKIVAMSSYLYGSILVNPRNYSINFRNGSDEVVDSEDMEIFFHNLFSWLSGERYENEIISIATNKRYTTFWSIGGWNYSSDAQDFELHENYNANLDLITDFETLDPETHPILILEEFGRYGNNSIVERYLEQEDLEYLLTYLRKGGSVLLLESFQYPDNEPKTIMEKLLEKAGLYVIRNRANGVSFLPKHNKVGGVHEFDMCVQDYFSLTDLERKLGITTYENVPEDMESLVSGIIAHGGESGLEGKLDEILKGRKRTVYKVGTEENSTISDCTVTVVDENNTEREVEVQLVKGDGIPGDGNNWYKSDYYAKYPIDLGFVEAQGDMSGKMNELLAHEEGEELLGDALLEQQYTNMYALLMNDANFSGEKFENLNSLLDLYKEPNTSKTNEFGEFSPSFVLNYREKPVTRIMLERAFYDSQLLYDPTSFPGKVVAGDTETATIFLKKISEHSQWYARNMQSTGLFAPAHEEVTVTVPAGVDFTKLQLQVGVGDNVSGLIKHELKLRRPPRIVKKYSFSSNTLTFKHPYGGLIFITSHDRNPTSEMATFTFENVEKAILFKLGETTEVEWEEMRNFNSPKAELQTKHFILTVARKNLSELEFSEVEDIANGYDEVVENAYDFYGYDRNCSEDIVNFTIHTPPTCETRKGYRHREVFDPHISIGAGHSGYPIMIMNWKPDSRKFPQNPRNSWLLWHELGHNTAKKWLTLPGAIEVANNVMALYQQKKFGLPLRTNSRMSNSGILVSKPQSYGDGGAFGRLLMFAQIPLWVEENYLAEFQTRNTKYFEADGTPKFDFLDGSAWDLYKIMHRESRESGNSCSGDSTLTKTENFGVCISSILGLDLSNFLEEWEAGTVGAGNVDGISIYDTSGGFGQNGKDAISDMSLPTPNTPIQNYTGN